MLTGLPKVVTQRNVLMNRICHTAVSETRAHSQIRQTRLTRDGQMHAAAGPACSSACFLDGLPLSSGMADGNLAWTLPADLPWCGTSDQSCGLYLGQVFQEKGAGRKGHSWTWGSAWTSCSGCALDRGLEVRWCAGVLGGVAHPHLWRGLFPTLASGEVVSGSSIQSQTNVGELQTGNLGHTWKTSLLLWRCS